ncbi:MAG: riboflavin kinase [Christensenellales bacterium]
MPEVTLGGLHVSSTEIRRLLSAGDVAGAARLLGRRYALHGTVAHGKQNGRLLGFPTANLAVDGRFTCRKRVFILPILCSTASHSVGDECRNESDARRRFGHGRVVILDFSDDIYGVCASVEFIERDRDELRFSSADELREAIAGSVLRRRELAAR